MVPDYEKKYLCSEMLNNVFEKKKSYLLTGSCLSCSGETHAKSFSTHSIPLQQNTFISVHSRRYSTQTLRNTNCGISNKGPAADQVIKEYKYNVVAWETEETDTTEASTECLQLRSNKSHVSLSAAPVVFYPLHITLLRISEEIRKKHISSAAVVCAYSSVTFESTESNSGIISPENIFKLEKRRNIPRTKLIQLLH